jgi:hypothetical protein
MGAALGRTKPTRAAFLRVDAGPQGLSERLITWHLRESHSTRCRALQSAAELAFIGEESAEETFASIIAAGDDVLAQGQAVQRIVCAMEHGVGFQRGAQRARVRRFSNQ